MGFLDKEIKKLEKMQAELRKSQPTLDDLMDAGATRMLNGREIVLGQDEKGRIGWVYKDTNKPAKP